MTALARKLAELGLASSETIGDDMINAGVVYRDANDQVRVAGAAAIIDAVQETTTSVKAALTKPVDKPEKGKR